MNTDGRSGETPHEIHRVTYVTSVSTPPTSGDPYGAPQGQPSGQPQPPYQQPPYQQQGQFPPGQYQQPGYDQGGPGYGSPALGGPAAAPPAEPKEVTTSFWLWIASIVLGVIGAIVAFVNVGQITSEVAAASGGADVDSSAVTTAITAALVAGAVFAIVIVALQLLFAIFMRKGRNWARIVLTIFGAIGVVSALAGLAGGTSTTINGQTIQTSGPVSIILSLVQAVIIVVAIVMFFRPPANAYFKAHSGRP